MFDHTDLRVAHANQEEQKPHQSQPDCVWVYKRVVSVRADWDVKYLRTYEIKRRNQSNWFISDKTYETLSLSV